jgi:hypothetical protein
MSRHKQRVTPPKRPFREDFLIIDDLVGDIVYAEESEQPEKSSTEPDGAEQEWPADGEELLEADRQADCENMTPEQLRQELRELREQLRLLAIDESKNPKKYLQCPMCFNTLGGRRMKTRWHTQVSGRQVKRSYLCDSCGGSWEVEADIEFLDGIEMRTTRIVAMRGPTE